MPSDQQAGTRAATKTIVVIPTFNEADNLPTMVAELHALAVPGLAMLIVDDNSPDGTGEVADRLAEHYPGEVHVRHRPEKQGLGLAYRDGFARALEMGGDFLVQMDADFSHPRTAIPTMLALMDQFDVVVGSRYVAGGELDERWGWWRRFLSWWANEVWSRRILGLETRDITAGFKCWRRATLEGIGLDRLRSNGYAFQVEMTFLTEHLGYRVKEIPIHFEDRRIGESKMSIPVKIQGALDVFRIRWRHRNAARQS